MGLEVKNLSFSYENKVIFNDLNFAVDEKTVCALIGQSGCGKTTLLSTIAQILQPTSGSIMLNSHNICVKKQKIGLVMQNYDLMPWLTVKENCLLPYKIKDLEVSHSVLETLAHYLEILGILAYQDIKLSKLSKGQQQRVSLARVFLLDPELILLDEPFANLDLFHKDDAIRLFLSLWHEKPKPTLLVTHSIDEALLMSSKIMIFNTSGYVVHTIDNPLFGLTQYRYQDEYPILYEKIEALIKGDCHEE